MARKKVLALCPTWKDKRELMQSHIQEQYDIIFHHYDDGMLERIICSGIGWITEKFEPSRVITDILQLCAQHNIEAIITTEDYPGSIFASIIADKMGLSAPATNVVLTCQHKYYARCKQKLLVPEATPQFALVDIKHKQRTCELAYPFFIKPVKSFFSVYASQTTDQSELEQYLENSCMPDSFLYQFNQAKALLPFAFDFF